MNFIRPKIVIALVAITSQVFLFQNCSNLSSLDQSGLGSSAKNTDSTDSGAGSGSGPTINPAAPVTAAELAQKSDFVGSTWPPPAVQLSSSECSSPVIGTGRTINVGPGKEYTELTDVPFLSLVAGDVVNIYYRTEPYRTKFGLVGVGTKDRPIVINGVTDGNCNRPIISGENAVTATDARNANYASGVQTLGLIVIWRKPTDPMDTYVSPQYIRIQNLKLTQAKVGKSFTGNNGESLTYDNFAASIYARRVSQLIVENCELTGNGQGIFTNSIGTSTVDYSENLIIRGNKIYDNGNDYRSTEHNLYLQAKRVLVEGNYIGKAAGGSSLKDRSSGTVVRYNRIISSARALDLVESEEEYNIIVRNDPLYDYAWVYGNLIINDCVTAPVNCSIRPIHWGYDNTSERSRKGILYFYQNTYWVKTSPSEWDTTIFQMGNNDGYIPPDAVNHKIEASGNIFLNDGTAGLNYLANGGWIDLRGINYTYINTSPVRNSNPGQYTTNNSVQIKTYELNQRIQLNGQGKLDSSQNVVVQQSNQDIEYLSAFPQGVTSSNLKINGQFAYPKGIAPRSVSPKMDLGAFQF